MMKKKLNINWTIVAIILTIIGVGYFISLVHEVNEEDREREYNIHHYSTGKSSSGSYSTGGSSSGTSPYGNSSVSYTHLEATEIVIAAKNPDAEELRYEIADFLYHMIDVYKRQAQVWSA